MSSLLKGLCLGAAAAWLLAAPAAHAFTVENKDGGGSAGAGFTASPYSAPKFDIEEQAKNFRNPGSSITSPGPKSDFSTPYGSGSVQFGVQGSNFGGTGYNPAGTSSGITRTNRMDFERMVTPDSLR